MNNNELNRQPPGAQQTRQPPGAQQTRAPDVRRPVTPKGGSDTDAGDLVGRWHVAVTRITGANPDLYDKLRRELEIPVEVQTNPAALRSKLADCESNRMLAVDLWRAAKIAEASYSRRIAADRETLRRRAQDQIEGRATIQATDAMMREIAGDQMTRWDRDEAQLHSVARSCEHLVNAWKNQSRILETLLYGAVGPS